MTALLLMPLTASAVDGPCANCHVMHASKLGITSTPGDYLLTGGCLGCHKGDNVGGATPFIYPDVAAPGDMLAGGNFYYVRAAGGNDRKGHNPVEGVLAADGLPAFAADPPGWKADYATTAAGPQAAGQQVPDAWGGANRLTCAGTYGCHGRHDGVAAAMHHANATGLADVIDGGTLGESYRFLYGIAGGEDLDYEYETALTHNVYIGANRAAGAADTTATTGTNTMSFFCAECHGLFHSGNDAATDGLDGATIGSPWLRHPVDFSMPLTGEYAGYATYKAAVPVATSLATGALNNFTVESANERIVMCLSCHYAHAGPNDAALRWDYTLMDAGAGANTTGCFACHTTKDTP